MLAGMSKELQNLSIYLCKKIDEKFKAILEKSVKMSVHYEHIKDHKKGIARSLDLLLKRK